MQITPIKRPQKKSDWMGLRVQATREAENRYILIPEGRLGRVTEVPHGKIEVTFDACPCCGVSPLMVYPAPYDGIEPVAGEAEK